MSGSTKNRQKGKQMLPIILKNKTWASVASVGRDRVHEIMKEFGVLRRTSGGRSKSKKPGKPVTRTSPRRKLAVDEKEDVADEEDCRIGAARSMGGRSGRGK